ncbi:hypothetical protein TNCV_3866331 [Trichonephila clavipes]|nr:hypothetical protein TNCV_3866331 [Trichonephila clavipes]
MESVEEGERKVDVDKAFEIPLSSLSTILKNKEKIFSASSSRVRKRVSKALIMIDKAWRAVTPLTIHSCFKKSSFSSPNLVDVDDTLTEFNAKPSLCEALPEQDLTTTCWLTQTLLYEELYLTLKLWLWTTIMKKVMKTNWRS